MDPVQGESTASVEDPGKWALLRRALASEPTFLRPESVMEWFRRKAPSVDLLWVEGALEAATVNYSGRRHYPSSQDLIFRHPDGSLERYDPIRHGRWSRSGIPIASAAERSRGIAPQARPLVPESPLAEAQARRILSGHLGPLAAGELQLRDGVAAQFDLLSADEAVVGKLIRVGEGGQARATAWARISEWVWLLEQAPRAVRRLVIFVEDADFARAWLRRFGSLCEGVDFYLAAEGRLQDLRTGRDLFLPELAHSIAV